MSVERRHGSEAILFSWAFLTVGDISKWLGVPRRKILMLVEQGLVIPKDPAPGSGKSRKYSLTELILFVVLSRLDDFGIAPRYLRSIASEINDLIRSRPSIKGGGSSLLFVTKGDGTSLKVLVSEEAIDSEPLALIINLRTTEIEVLRLFLKHASITEGGDELLRMVGREHDSEGIEAFIKKWVSKGERMQPN